MPTPLIPDMAVFQRKLATLPLSTYQAGETVLSAASTTLAMKTHARKSKAAPTTWEFPGFLAFEAVMVAVMWADSRSPQTAPPHRLAILLSLNSSSLHRYP